MHIENDRRLAWDVVGINSDGTRKHMYVYAESAQEAEAVYRDEMLARGYTEATLPEIIKAITAFIEPRPASAPGPDACPGLESGGASETPRSP